MDKLLLTVEQAAEALSMSRASPYRLVGRGEVPMLKIGGMSRASLVSQSQLPWCQGTGSNRRHRVFQMRGTRLATSPDRSAELEITTRLSQSVASCPGPLLHLLLH